MAISAIAPRRECDALEEIEHDIKCNHALDPRLERSGSHGKVAAQADANQSNIGQSEIASALRKPVAPSTRITATPPAIPQSLLVNADETIE